MEGKKLSSFILFALFQFNSSQHLLISTRIKNFLFFKQRLLLLPNRAYFSFFSQLLNYYYTKKKRRRNNIKLDVIIQ